MAHARRAVEDLGLNAMPNASFWAGRRVLLTGHTGFKGSWAWAWLNSMGAQVTGLALAPETSPALADLLGIGGDPRSLIGDIRRHCVVAEAVEKAQPQIVLHMAAQALVRRSYVEPVETFDTNVMGTLHLLQALRTAPGLEVCLVITSDKVYENDGSGRAYIETDPLGGSDVYSASKGACEIAVSSFARSYFSRGPAVVATARAGNVIGGGDWSADRIVPDLWRARQARQPVSLRYPEATRPWQHVLEPIAGYLDFVEALAAGSPERALNFGPLADAPITVRELAEAFQRAYGDPAWSGWTKAPGEHPKEAATLGIDSRRAVAALPWRPRLGAADAVRWTAGWYAAYDRGEDMSAFTMNQIHAYAERAA